MAMFNYYASVAKAVDGDTVDLVIDLGFHTSLSIRTRLLGIDAPEVSTVAGKIARDWLRQQLPTGLKVEVATFRDPTDKYGRWLASIKHPQLGDIAQKMLELKFARPYDGGKKEPWPE